MSMFCFFVEIFACSFDNGLKQNVLRVQSMQYKYSFTTMSANHKLDAIVWQDLFVQLLKMIPSNLTFHKCALKYKE